MTTITPSPTMLYSLPNEILLKTLHPFPTPSLLALAAVSRRLHDLVARELRARLAAAAALDDHKLILECYHPASKNTEPYLFCDYLGTPGLRASASASAAAASDGDADRDADAARGEPRRPRGLGRLRGLYSRFRPIPPEAEHRIFRANPAGGPAAAGGDGDASAAAAAAAASSDGDAGSSVVYTNRPASPWPSPGGAAEPQPQPEPRPERRVTHAISLDPDEGFSQLCVVTNLVKLGPRRGVFANFVNVSDGVVRVKRDWLAARAEAQREEELHCERERRDTAAEASDIRELGHHDDGSREDKEWDGTNKGTLWLGGDRNVGLITRIRERKWKREVPVLLHRNEDPAVSYSMEYEELWIRTIHLLLAVEKATMQDTSNDSGKAIVFGSFVSRTATGSA